MSPFTTRPTTWQLMTRAARLRCPQCGGRGIFRSFFEFREHCPTCGMRLQRGEGDYFIGAYLFNLIAVEMILAVCVGTFVVMTWPDPPWEMITYVTAALMLTGCVVCYPFAKTTFLAVDLAVRPMTREELHWHREDGAHGERELPQI